MDLLASGYGLHLEKLIKIKRTWKFICKDNERETWHAWRRTFQMLQMQSKTKGVCKEMRISTSVSAVRTCLVYMLRMYLKINTPIKVIS